MSIGKNIACLRKKRGLTQAELGEMLGVSNQAVSKWESETTMPDVLLLPSIADVFECSIDELFSYVPKSKKAKLNTLPGDSVPDVMKKYLSDQVRCQLDHDGSTNKFLEVMADNLSGDFELTDENIEKLLDAYRDLYKGMRKKKVKAENC